jgi:aryl-alcohol dehydrogenase-like predicted oxidoreductase
MKYRRLGIWGVKLSEIGFGSWLIFNNGDQTLCDQLHRTAYENGINFYDTSNAYGRGQTEVMVGKALKPFRRDTYVLATKAFWPFDPTWPFPEANDRGLSRKHLFEQCHASLKRLSVEYIDLYQCHRYDEHTPLIETCRAMNDLIEMGKVLYWGVSEWTAQQIDEAVRICKEHHWHAPVSNQPLFNMLERHWEAEVFPMCRTHGLGIVNFSPLAEGLLSGKYNKGVPNDSRAADEKAGAFIKPRMTQENLAIIGKLSAIANELGIAMPQLALAWCLSKPELTSTIIGATKPQQIVENAKASEVVLDEATLERIAMILRQ